jgi:hypothetical protein
MMHYEIHPSHLRKSKYPHAGDITCTKCGSRMLVAYFDTAEGKLPCIKNGGRLTIVMPMKET